MKIYLLEYILLEKKLDKQGYEQFVTVSGVYESLELAKEEASKLAYSDNFIWQITEYDLNEPVKFGDEHRELIR